MDQQAPTWGRLLYPVLLHASPKVRERALYAISLGLPAMLKHREEVAKTLPSDLEAVSVRLI
jgi:hypothetical protein